MSRWFDFLNTALTDSLRTLAILLTPFAPFISSELWARLEALLPALRYHSRWWRSDLMPPHLSAVPVSSAQRGQLAVPVVICGPILSLPITGTESSDAADAAAWAVANLARSDSRHRYGIGLSAASGSYPFLAPPVYRFSVTDWRVELPAMVPLWLRPPTPTEAQHAAKAALVAADPDRHRCLHPSLLGSKLVTV